ncbi:MAG: hypothetical protein IPH09_03655 [bacterium]|nr:hypothetical protein [bacterium]
MTLDISNPTAPVELNRERQDEESYRICSLDVHDGILASTSKWTYFHHFDHRDNTHYYSVRNVDDPGSPVSIGGGFWVPTLVT